VIKEGDALKIDRAGVLSLISGRDLEGAVDVLVVPRGKIKKSGEIGAKKIGIYIPKKGEDGRFIVAVTGRDQTIMTEEKIKKLREKLAQRKDKQIDVAEGKQAIKRLEADLVKQKLGKRLKVKVGEKPLTFTLIRPHAIAMAENGIWIVKSPGKKSTTIITGSGPNISIMFDINPGENSREVCDRIVARVKQELPDGYAIEPEFNEKSGAVTLKIAGSGMAKVPKDLIKKVVDVIKTEIK
jgi:hypothetical protein